MFHLPQDDLCGFFCNFPGKSNALPDMPGRFQYHAMSQGAAAETAVSFGKKVVQFPGKTETAINPRIFWPVPAKDHANCHYASGHGAAGTTGARE